MLCVSTFFPLVFCHQHPLICVCLPHVELSIKTHQRRRHRTFRTTWTSFLVSSTRPLPLEGSWRPIWMMIPQQGRGLSGLNVKHHKLTINVFFELGFGRIMHVLKACENCWEVYLGPGKDVRHHDQVCWWDESWPHGVWYNWDSCRHSNFHTLGFYLA